MLHINSILLYLVAPAKSSAKKSKKPPFYKTKQRFPPSGRRAGEGLPPRRGCSHCGSVTPAALTVPRTVIHFRRTPLGYALDVPLAAYGGNNPSTNLRLVPLPLGKGGVGRRNSQAPLPKGGSARRAVGDTRRAGEGLPPRRGRSHCGSVTPAALTVPRTVIHFRRTPLRYAPTSRLPLRGNKKPPNRLVWVVWGQSLSLPLSSSPSSSSAGSTVRVAFSMR